MKAKAVTACFTGHREIRPQDAKVLKENTRAVIRDLILQGYKYFGAGGARGFDTLAAEVVLELKDIYPQAALILVLPFKNQYKHESGWYREDIERYETLKYRAQKVVYLQESYSTGCYYRRNQHLVNYSSVCIAYKYKETGGTAYTVREAETQGLKIINCI